MPKKNKHTPIGKSEQNVYEGNLYDKIFKENAEEIFMPLVEARLGIKIKKFIALPTKMQTTTEP
ncbi:MAG: hypothetical protein JNL70_00855 [Saprospiraceae bacterium]|nr:hypothetical protein [Saprospiraceae bacterium]